MIPAAMSVFDVHVHGLPSHATHARTHHANDHFRLDVFVQINEFSVVIEPLTAIRVEIFSVCGLEFTASGLGYYLRILI